MEGSKDVAWHGGMAAGWLDGGGQSPTQTQSNTGEWKKRFHVHAADILLTAAAVAVAAASATGSPSVDSALYGPPKELHTKLQERDRGMPGLSEGQKEDMVIGYLTPWQTPDCEQWAWQQRMWSSLLTSFAQPQNSPTSPTAGSGQSLSFACCRNFYRNSISPISVLFYFVLVELHVSPGSIETINFWTWEGYMSNPAESFDPSPIKRIKWIKVFEQKVKIKQSLPIAKGIVQRVFEMFQWRNK